MPSAREPRVRVVQAHFAPRESSGVKRAVEWRAVQLITVLGSSSIVLRREPMRGQSFTPLGLSASIWVGSHSIKKAARRWARSA